MVWTSPMTFVANNVLTAAQLNNHLRDNLLETAPAKATTDGGSWFVSQGPNKLEERIIKSHRVATTQTTTSQDWTNLSTGGPMVTVETGTSVLVMLGCAHSSDTAETAVTMGFSITGETTRTPSDSQSLQADGRGSGDTCRFGMTFFLNDLSPGLNTFTCKYKTTQGTATFADRFLAVIPF